MLHDPKADSTTSSADKKPTKENTMASTIRSYIPPLDELPEQLHDVANKASQAIRDHEAARDTLRIAHHRNQQAPKEDAALLKEAAQEGKGDPGTPNTDKAGKALAKTEREAEIARINNDKVQRDYAEQMAIHRDALAQHNQPGIHEALAHYREAHEALQAAARDLRGRARWVTLLDQLDTHGTFSGHGGNTSGNILHADELRWITESTDAMTTALPPEQVDMTDGTRTRAIPTSLAPSHTRKGWTYTDPDDARWETEEPKRIRRPITK